MKHYKNRFDETGKRVFAWVNRANSLKTTEPRKALSLVNQALKHDPDNKFALGIGTECLVKLKDFPNALTWAMKNIRIGENEVSYGLLFLVFTFMGKFDEALEAAEKSAFLAPHNNFSREQLRRALLQKKLERRVENSDLQNQYDKNAEILFQDGCEKIKSGRLEDALTSIIEAIELSPQRKFQDLLFEILELRENARRKKERKI